MLDVYFFKLENINNRKAQYFQYDKIKDKVKIDEDRIKDEQ